MTSRYLFRTFPIVTYFLLAILVCLLFLLIPNGQRVFAAFGDFVEVHKDGLSGIDGLGGAIDIAMSPDGKYLYLVGDTDNALTIFSRNPDTGQLTHLETLRDGMGLIDGLRGAHGLAISPDGENVYAVGLHDDGIAVFNRDVSTGLLTYMEIHKEDGLDGSVNVIVSPDGNNVYATGLYDDAGAVFTRNVTTGALTYVSMHKDGVRGVDGLDGARDIDITPDGKHVYIGSQVEDGLAVFSRDLSTGALTFLEALKTGNGVFGVKGIIGIDLSPDGKHVYVTSFSESSLAIFSRDVSTGLLTYVDVYEDGEGDIDGLSGAWDVAISPDGFYAFATGRAENALSVFSRDPITGALTYLVHHVDDQSGVDGLDGAMAIAATTDSKHIYATGYNEGGLSVLIAYGASDLSWNWTWVEETKTLDAVMVLGSTWTSSADKVQFFVDGVVSETFSAPTAGFIKKFNLGIVGNEQITSSPTDVSFRILDSSLAALGATGSPQNVDDIVPDDLGLKIQTQGNSALIQVKLPLSGLSSEIAWMDIYPNYVSGDSPKVTAKLPSIGALPTDSVIDMWVTGLTEPANTFRVHFYDASDDLITFAEGLNVNANVIESSSSRMSFPGLTPERKIILLPTPTLVVPTPTPVLPGTGGVAPSQGFVTGLILLGIFLLVLGGLGIYLNRRF